MEVCVRLKMWLKTMVRHCLRYVVSKVIDFLKFHFTPVRNPLNAVTTTAWLILLTAISLLCLLYDFLFRPRVYVQTAAMLLLLIIFNFSIFGLVILWNLCFSSLFWLGLLYMCYSYYDRHRPKTGGRQSTWLRQWCFYNYFRDYFPIRIIKTAHLDPQKNYVFGYHPHGTACLGIRCFTLEAMNFSELFPGIKPYILTKDTNFNWPFIREYLMAEGFCSESEESMTYLLSRQETGIAIIKAVGGADEMQEAYPGSTNIALAKRKEFVRICLEYGASLVPVYAFGENDIFSVINGPNDSFLREVRKFLNVVLCCCQTLYFGRGLLPHRTPINVVVGAPIHLPKIPLPAEELILEIHDVYVMKLTDLFEDHKDAYGYGGPRLKIV